MRRDLLGASGPSRHRRPADRVPRRRDTRLGARAATPAADASETRASESETQEAEEAAAANVPDGRRQRAGQREQSDADRSRIRCMRRDRRPRPVLVAFGVTPGVDFRIRRAGRQATVPGRRFQFFRDYGSAEPPPVLACRTRSSSAQTGRLTASGQADRRVASLDIELALVLAGGKALARRGGGEDRRCPGSISNWPLNELDDRRGRLPVRHRVTLQPSGSSDSHSDFSFGGHIGMRLTRQFNRRTGVTIGVRWRAVPFHPEIKTGSPSSWSASGGSTWA